jgi:hypothetical protein
MSSWNYRTGRQALTDFFFELSMQKAYWYLLILPTASDEITDRICATFLPLSRLLNLE